MAATLSDLRAAAKCRSMFIAKHAEPLSTSGIRFIAHRNARRLPGINLGLIQNAAFAVLMFVGGLIKGEVVDFAAQ